MAGEIDLVSALCVTENRSSESPAVAVVLGEIRDQLSVVHGPAVTVLSNYPGGSNYSSTPVSMDGFNAALVVVEVSPWIAQNQQFIIRVQGSIRGVSGFVDLPDAMAVTPYGGGTNRLAVAVGCGTEVLRVNLTDWSNSTPDPTGGGVTVTVVPYRAAGLSINAIRSAAIRGPTIIHRSGVTAPDTLAVPTVGALSGVSDTGGALAASTTYYVAVAAKTAYGYTTTTTPTSFTTAASGQNAIRVPITPIANATGYAVFLSTAANPLWVGEVTQAQLQSGGYAITAVGTVNGGFSNPANTIDVLVVGTGVASNAAPFSANTAFVVPPPGSAPVRCVGYSVAHLEVSLAITDGRSQPSLTFVPFFQNANGVWFAGARQVVNVLGAPGQVLNQAFDVQVSGATQMAVLFDTLSGSGAAVSVTVELS